MSKNKNLILLKDYVNEHMLLEQFEELYGCREGYGYNPFTKECYPIPSDMDPANYKSLAPPKVVKRKPSDSGSGSGLAAVAAGAQQSLVNAVNLAKNPVESSKQCFDQHPIASWFGVYTGLGAPGLGMALRGAGRTAMALTPGGLKGAVVLGIAGLGTLAYLGTRFVLSELDAIEADPFGKGSEYVRKGLSAKKQIEIHIKNLESIAQNAEKVFNPDSPEGQNALVTSPSCFLLVAAGTYAIKKTGGMLAKPVTAAAIRKSNDFLAYVSKTMSTALLRRARYMKGSDSSAYIFLKSSNLLPSNGGSIDMIEKGSNTILQIRGAGDVLKIDASKLPEKLQKKFSKKINNGVLEIDVKQANRELLDISEDVATSAQKTMEREASESVRRGSAISDLKKIQRMLARGGDLSPQVLRNEYFKSSSEVLTNLVNKERENLIRLHKDAMELKKLKPSIDPKKLRKAQQDIVSGVSPSRVSREFGVSEKYLTSFKKYSTKQEEVLKKFSLVKEVMEKDAKFTKFYSDDVASTNLKSWFKTPNGAAAKTKTQKAVATIRDILPTIEDVWASTGFLKTMKYFAYSAFLSGAVYQGKKFINNSQNQLSLPSLDASAKVFFENTVAKNYGSYFTGTRQNKKVNTNKLLEDFQAHYLETLDQTSDKQVVAASTLKDLVSASKNDKDVDAHFNRRTQRGDWKDLYQDFISFLSGQLSESSVPIPAGTSRESIEKIFGSFGEKGKDWQQVPGKREIRGTAVNEMWRNFEKVSLPWGGKTWFHKKIANEVREIAEIANKSGYKPKTFVGANPRTISTKPDSSISLHSYGITFDIDSKENARPKVKSDLTQTQAGRDFAKAWVDAGWDWGVHWETPDTMHFERTNRGWTWPMYERFFKEKDIELLDKPIAESVKEIKKMNKTDIKQLVAEILNESSGKGYAPYPYGSSVRDEEQPKEDYIEEWKALSIEVIRDESRETAIQIAKILVKDLELFEDVLDLAGQNQSVGTEILTKLKQSKEKA